MSSFHKKNPIINKIITSEEFKKDIPKNILTAFKSSAKEDPDLADYIDDLDDSVISKDMPVYMLSKEVQRAADMIDPNKIRNSFDFSELPFQRATILLGSDVDGMYYIQHHSISGRTFLSFTFLSGSSSDEVLENRQLGTIVSLPIQFLHSKVKTLEYDITIKLLQILVYMHYGDIFTKKYGKKEGIKTTTRGVISNTSDFDISYVNTLWKQRVSTSGFSVGGHWRLQPFGSRKNPEKKLIWIEEFEKTGYNRKAGKELNY